MYRKHKCVKEAWTWFGSSTTAAANAVVDDDQRHSTLLGRLLEVDGCRLGPSVELGKKEQKCNS